MYAWNRLLNIETGLEVRLKPVFIWVETAVWTYSWNRLWGMETGLDVRLKPVTVIEWGRDR